MLACAVATPGDARQRRRADRVIAAPPVENVRLVPDLIRDLPPTEPPIDSLRVHGLVQRNGVKIISLPSRVAHIAPVDRQCLTSRQRHRPEIDDHFSSLTQEVQA